mgnify:CR=1 FL=1
MKKMLPGLIVFLSCMAAALYAQAPVSASAASRQGGGGSSGGGAVAFKTPQEAMRYYESRIDTLMQRVTTMQDDNARLEASVMDLRREVETLARSNEELSAEVTRLKRQIAADAEVREAQLEKIADRLTRSQVPDASSSAGAMQEYVEYTVQPGATLSAISKAYGVSISDIKKANNMSSDVLRIGQKLKIPVR